MSYFVYCLKLRVSCVRLSECACLDMMSCQLFCLRARFSDMHFAIAQAAAAQSSDEEEGEDEGGSVRARVPCGVIL